MDLTLLLLLGLGAALIIPNLGGDDDDDESETERKEIRGTLGDDPELNGTDGDDFIRGFDGNDTINAGAGEDIVEAGLGDDIVNGGEDRDIIRGRAGNDILNGDGGSDTIEGGLGIDIIDGGAGFDILRGGNDNDTIFGGARATDDGSGNLVVEEVTPGDITRGNDGDDIIYNWGGRGLLAGGSGNDTLVLVSGQGTLEDEDGETDFYILANAQDADIPTRGTITEFNPAQDTLTLTVDGELGGAPAPEVEFTLEERTIDEGGTPVNGVFVKAQIVDGQPDVPGSEGAGVFLRGATIAGLAGADIEVVFTDGADYFNPDDTLRALGVTATTALPT